MSKIWIIGGGVFLGALLVAAVLVALTQEEVALPDGTPGRAVQLFLNALEDEDFRAAYNRLSVELRKDCKVERMAAGYSLAERDLKSSKVILGETVYLNGPDGPALVTARVSGIRGSGPFGTSEYTRQHSYTLAKENAVWRFSEVPRWPYLECWGPQREPPAPAPASPPDPTAEPAATTTATS